MAVQNFVVDLMEQLLDDKELALTEQDIRFYDKGTTAETDESLDDHIRWSNARYFNEDSNVVRNSVLIVKLEFDNGTEYVNFHVGDLYRIYRKDGMKAILPVIKENIRTIRATAGKNLVLINQLQDYAAIRDQLIIRPLNYDDNSKVLAKGIYRRVGDIALVLYISMGNIDHGTHRNILSTMVLRELLEGWNVDENDTFEWALKNTMQLQPPVFYNIANEITGKQTPSYIRFMENENFSINFDTPLAPVLTTEQEINGAVAAFYPGVLERIYQMVGGDFYLVFSGIYDVHIHPVNGKLKVRAMRSTLADMNRNANRREEIVSRKLYRYYGETKKIEVYEGK